jgi:hypothetical protein
VAWGQATTQEGGMSATLLLTWALQAGKAGPSVWPSPTANTWGQSGLTDLVIYIRPQKEEEKHPRDQAEYDGGRSLSP